MKTVRISDEHHQKLKIKSVRTGYTLFETINLYIEEYLKNRAEIKKLLDSGELIIRQPQEDKKNEWRIL